MSVETSVAIHKEIEKESTRKLWKEMDDYFLKGRHITYDRCVLVTLKKVRTCYSKMEAAENSTEE